MLRPYNNLDLIDKKYINNYLKGKQRNIFYKEQKCELKELDESCNKKKNLTYNKGTKILYRCDKRYKPTMLVMKKGFYLPKVQKKVIKKKVVYKLDAATVDGLVYRKLMEITRHRNGGEWKNIARYHGIFKCKNETLINMETSDGMGNNIWRDMHVSKKKYVKEILKQIFNVINFVNKKVYFGHGKMLLRNIHVHKRADRMVFKMGNFEKSVCFLNKKKIITGIKNIRRMKVEEEGKWVSFKPALNINNVMDAKDYISSIILRGYRDIDKYVLILSILMNKTFKNVEMGTNIRFKKEQMGMLREKIKSLKVPKSEGEEMKNIARILTTKLKDGTYLKMKLKNYLI